MSQFHILKTSCDNLSLNVAQQPPTGYIFSFPVCKWEKWWEKVETVGMSLSWTHGNVDVRVTVHYNKVWLLYTTWVIFLFSAWLRTGGALGWSPAFALGLPQSPQGFYLWCTGSTPKALRKGVAPSIEQAAKPTSTKFYGSGPKTEAEAWKLQLPYLIRKWLDFKYLYKCGTDYFIKVMASLWE